MFGFSRSQSIAFLVMVALIVVCARTCCIRCS